MSGDTVILRCGIHLGSAADHGPKLREGDGRTPEGEYFISSKNPASKFHLALGLSYPGPHDARRGLEKGIIDAETYEKICASPHRPPWDTPMGGFIMIHGQRSDAPSGDWTAGCIAVENPVMDRLFAMCGIGDRVEILP